MTLHPLPNFESLETHHCVTGSLRHIYVFNNHSLSEDLLLGLGGGVGFIYWHMKGALPFIGGRANARGEFEPLVGQRTGVTIEAHRTSSASKAKRVLVDMLDAGQPVMLHVDMGFLPYFDFGGNEYHFGGHVVVACGYDATTGQVLIADRDSDLHPVPMDVLEKARGSAFKPFPPKNTWYTFDFGQKRAPMPGEVRAAVAEQVQGALEPPIRNFGVAGIRKTAAQIRTWPALLSEDDVHFAMFNTYIMIDAAGGTGGGLFRYMFARFLREAGTITGASRLLACADTFQSVGDHWQEIAMLFKRGWSAESPAEALAEIVAPLRSVADAEEAAWTALRECV